MLFRMSSDIRSIVGRPTSRLITLPAEGQREPGLLQPPFTQVQNFVQALLAVRELSLVDQQTGIVLTLEDLVQNLVERDDFILHVGFEEPQRQKGGRQLAGNRYCFFNQTPGLKRPAGHNDRSIVPADTCAAGKEYVFVRQVRVCMERDRRNFELAFERLSVQCFDVAQLVDIVEITGIDLASRERVKHECVV